MAKSSTSLDNARVLATLAVSVEAELQRRRTVGAGGRGETGAFTHRRIGGVHCFGSLPLGGFSPRVLGFGLLGPARADTLDAILRHYARLGQACRIVVSNRVSDSETVPLLRSHGFQRDEWTGAGHALVAEGDEERLLRRADRAPNAPGVIVEQLHPDDASVFARAMRKGFEARGRWTVFARSTERLLQAHPRTVLGFVGRSDGAVAGSGALILHSGGGLLFSGSVIARHRGKGVQPALIAARVQRGIARGTRAFFAQTSLDGPSAHNMRDAGFRQPWTFTFWVRAV